MYAKVLSAAAVALVAADFACAQTFSACNPAKGQKCPADPAAPDSVTIDFTKGANDFFELAGGTTLSYDPSLGAVFRIASESNAPTVTSRQYIFFGRVDVVARSAPGAGIISSFVLQSDDLDEIDWEWLGADNGNAQTNYFSKGDDSTYDRGGISPAANNQGAFHKYSIDWTTSTLTWLIDDVPLRTLHYNDAKGGATYPQTPMQVKLGTWVAGRSGAPEGTINWAGGLANFANGPFDAYFKSVTVINYSNGVKGATEYSYGDSSGSMGSIVIKTDGGSSSSGGSSKSDKSSTSAAPSSTKASTSASATAASSSSSTAAPSSTLSTVTTPTSSATVTKSSDTKPTNVNAVQTSSSSEATAAPKSAAGKLGLTLGNVAVMGAAAVVGLLFL